MNDRTHILETLGELGVDVDRLLHRALTAEMLVRGWRTANGITTDEKLISALPELLSTSFPPSHEWQLLASIGEVLESPSVRFAVVNLIRDAAFNFARPGGQDARKALAAIASALPHTGHGRRRAVEKARRLDERRWDEAHRLAEELRGLARRTTVTQAERERLADMLFLAWDGRAWCGFDPQLLVDIARDVSERAGRGARPFLEVAANLLSAGRAEGAVFATLRDRRKKWGARERTSPLSGGPSRESLRKTSRPKPHSERSPTCPDPSPKAERPERAPAPPKGASSSGAPRSPRKPTPRKAGGAGSKRTASARRSSASAESASTTGRKPSPGSAGTRPTPRRPGRSDAPRPRGGRGGKPP